MKKIFLFAAAVAVSLSVSAQKQMHVWVNGNVINLPISQVDSVTFTDPNASDPTIPNPNPNPDPSTAGGLGVFTIAEGKTVCFSPGNLQFNAVQGSHLRADGTAAKGTWRFAEHQWDYVGYDNEKIAENYDGWIDLFGWGTGKSPTNKSDDDNDYSRFVDWGVNKIDNDISNTWRTLTEDEWFYLLTKRKDASSLVGLATINGVFGLVLLPDYWLCPDGINFVNSLAQGYYQDYSQKFSSYDWMKLESTGAVFLPAAGNRSGTRYYGQQISGAYWSATEDDYYSWKNKLNFF